MAGMGRIRRVRRNDENIALCPCGEILGELNPFKGRLKSDLLYLDEIGLPRFQKIFSMSREDEIPYNRPANVLKRSVYILGCQLIKFKKQEVLAEYLQKQAEAQKAPLVSKAAPDVSQNPFLWCYHLLLGENRSPKGTVRLVSRDQMSKSSRQLVYAQWNDVPSESLIGFILQIGGDPILDLYSKEDQYGWKNAKRVIKKKKVRISNTHSPETPS